MSATAQKQQNLPECPRSFRGGINLPLAFTDAMHPDAARRSDHFCARVQDRRRKFLTWFAARVRFHMEQPFFSPS
jgi:hypothetical protein